MAIPIVYKARMRPEGMQVDSIVDYQRGKLERSLHALKQKPLPIVMAHRPMC